MKKDYESPRACVYTIIGQTILQGSIKVESTSGEKVSNSGDIGFVKGDRSNRNYDVWDENWSK